MLSFCLSAPKSLFWEQILLNVLGGFIVALLIEIWIKFRDHLKHRRFRNIFGFSSKNPFYIVYGLLERNGHPNTQAEKFPYIRSGVEDTRFGNIPIVLSEANAKGIKYLSESFGRNSNTTPFLVSDNEVKEKMDISYCSIGGRNNLKTNDLEKSDDNKFFKFNISEGSIVSVKNNKLKFTADEDFDYGFIIKLRPKALPNRTWVAIAGLGSPGTSGATWFLAKNWRKIEKIYGQRSFGLVVRVRREKDESTQIVCRSS